jgi:PAS domain S-box-containing protein
MFSSHDVRGPVPPSGDPEGTEYIEAQQVRLLYTHAPTGLITTIANVGIAILVLWRTVPALSLVSWAVLLVTISLARLLLVRAYHRTASAATQTRRWRLRFILGAGCAGTVWGAAGIFLFPHNSIPHEIFLIFIVGGMAAGAIATLSADKGAFLAFFIPTLLPVTARLLLAPAHETSVAMGLLLVAFAAVLLITALQFHASIVESLRLRLANLDLVQHLSLAKDQAERSNLQLTEANRALSAAVQATAASEERFRSLSAASPVGIFQTDGQGRVIYVNERWQQLTGLSLAEAEGEGWGRTVHREDRPGVLAEWTRTLREGGEFSCEFRVLTPGGETRWAHSRAQAVPSAHGRVLGYVGTVEDITERRRAEEVLRESQERYRSIIETAQDAFISIDTRGLVTDWNRQAELTFGWSRSEIVGQTLVETIIPPHYRQAHERGLRHFLATGEGPVLNQRIELTALHRDGHEFPVEITIWPGRRGVTDTFNAFVRDISERRAVERMKDEFVSVVSHELRTPLTSIRGALGLLTSGLVGVLPERGRRMLEIALNNTDRLVRLINDILDIERMQLGKVTVQRRLCDTAALLTQAVEEMQAMAEEAGVTLAVTSLPVRVWADPDRIIQTLTNLLSNAIKFSPAGGTVWVTVARQKEEAVFMVKDQGRGIPAGKLETIFERFQQVDASDARKRGGTGLGLAICRSIVRQHEGRIWAESVFGTGSSFFFTLPVWKEAEHPLSVPEVRPLILVCDDDPSVLEVVGAVLEHHGYQVVTATSGQEAVAQAAAQQPAAILLDLLMPGMNGWETMATLKSRRETHAIPIIIFSILSPQERTPSQPEFSGWVSKSSDEVVLFQALKRALEERARTALVLVVEDDLDLAKVLIAILQRHGIETVHARTGREAIEGCERWRPDLLVLDLILPDGDGFVVADWLKQHDQLRQMPVAVYSAKDLDAGERERLQLGRTEFFTKGRITPEEFEQRVMGLLARLVPNNGGSFNGHD